MNDPWSALEGAGLGAVALAALAGLVRWLWSWKERAEKREETSREKQLTDHEGRLTAAEKQIDQLRVLYSEAQKDFGRLEQMTSKLAEKLDGLQAFWRQEFEKLSEKMTGGMDKLRTDVRKDFEEHRQLVHDRMSEATRNMIATVEQVMAKTPRRGK